MGIVIGLGIVVGYELLHLFSHQVEEYVHHNPYLIFLFPTIGIPVAFMIVDRFSTAKASGGGSHRLLEAFHYEGGRMTLKDTIFEPLAAAITIGFGGSAGFEGPSLLLGGGIGSFVGQRLGLTADEVSIFLISGAAAGVSAIFKAPLTGIMFALEIPYQRDISREAFIPATLASISAYFTSISFIGSERLFPLLPSTMMDPLIPVHALIIGVLSAVVGALFVKSYEFFHVLRTRVRLNKYFYALSGGIMIGVIGFYMPEVTGIGFTTLGAMIRGEFLGYSSALLILLMVLKMLATNITLNSGGSGGVFIPSLFVGASLGTLYTSLIPNSGGAFIVVAAMAAMIAAANKTLLTSVALVAETAGPSSIVVTVVAAATSYFVSGKVSFYGHVQPLEELLEEEEAVHVIRHILEKTRSRSELSKIKVEDIMHDDPVTLPEGLGIREALERVTSCPYAEYPVTRDNRLLGIVTLEDLLVSTFDDEEKIIGDFRLTQARYVRVQDSLEDLIPLLEEGRQDCIYVVGDQDDPELLGVVSETDIRLKLLETYNRMYSQRLAEGK